MLPDERHLVVRAMTGDDVAGVLAIERSSYDDPWGADEFLSVLAQDQHRLVVACDGGGPVGYGVLRIDDWVGRVLSVAVDPSRRHQGVGRVLMTELARSAMAAGSHRLELEVRFKNAPARRLYESLGLTVLAVRRKYYPDDDALVMGGDLGAVQSRKMIT